MFFFGIKVKFHPWGGQQGMGKRRYWGEAKNEVVFFAKFQLLSKIQTLSHKLLVRQTSNHHHCHWHAPKTYQTKIFK